MSNIWHLAHQTPKTLPWNVLNAIIFGTHEQYCSIFETVHMKMLNKKKIYSFSLSSFIPLRLSFFSLFLFSSFFPRLSFHLLSLSSFFLLLSSLESSPLLPPFFLSLSLCFYFIFFRLITLSLSLLFSPPRRLPLRSAVAVEFSLIDEVD